MSLRLSGVRKTFGSIVAVDNLTLIVHLGELLVLLGPSGCGKTTVLRLIAGLEKPNAGTIALSDKEWTDLPPQRRDVAMVFQQYALYPQRTVRGNIEYPLHLRGINSEGCRNKIEWVSSLLGIEPLLDRKPGQLSGGEAQRVALARALVRDPVCFLMDEPLSNLDAQLRVRARGEIKKIQRKLKVTTIYVTHDQEEAVAIADRIAIMHKGRIMQVGTAQELFQRPANSFVAGFLGKPPMNFLQGIIAGKEDDFIVVKLETADSSNLNLVFPIRNAPPKKSKLLVGFRPDDIKLTTEKKKGDVHTSYSISGKVVLVEGLGPEYIIHCETVAGMLLVRTMQKQHEGPIHINLPLDRGHYFYAESGERIG